MQWQIHRSWIREGTMGMHTGGTSRTPGGRVKIRQQYMFMRALGARASASCSMVS
jgi:hypothetical protein